ALDEVHLALRKARAARPRPYGVGRFRREQRFVAGDEVCRQQPFPEVSGERVGGELQKTSSGEGRACAQPPAWPCGASGSLLTIIAICRHAGAARVVSMTGGCRPDARTPPRVRTPVSQPRASIR